MTGWDMTRGDEMDFKKSRCDVSQLDVTAHEHEEYKCIKPYE